jgi:glycosyltransferase involved in cell wall biosynthesis
VVNEAMAAGLPAIVTDGVASAGDLVVAGRTGAIVPVGALAALTTAMAELARDEPTRQTLARETRRHVARFDVTVAAEGTANAVRTILAARERAVNRDTAISAEDGREE